VPLQKRGGKGKGGKTRPLSSRLVIPPGREKGGERILRRIDGLPSPVPGKEGEEGEKRGERMLDWGPRFLLRPCDRDRDGRGSKGSLQQLRPSLFLSCSARKKRKKKEKMKKGEEALAVDSPALSRGPYPSAAGTRGGGEKGGGGEWPFPPFSGHRGSEEERERKKGRGGKEKRVGRFYSRIFGGRKRKREEGDACP